MFRLTFRKGDAFTYFCNIDMFGALNKFLGKRLKTTEF